MVVVLLLLVLLVLLLLLLLLLCVSLIRILGREWWWWLSIMIILCSLLPIPLLPLRLSLTIVYPKRHIDTKVSCQVGSSPLESKQNTHAQITLQTIQHGKGKVWNTCNVCHLV